MRKLIKLGLGGCGIIYANSALASSPIGVPEIDGAGLFLVLGVVVSVLALVRDKFNKK